MSAQKLWRCYEHILEGEFGHCLRCGAAWELAEDQPCRPYMLAARFAGYALRSQGHYDLTAAVGL